MKTTKVFTCTLCAALLFSGCNMNNTAKGGLIGGGGGALLGGIIGNIAGNTAVGAAIGGVVGAGAGVLIGKKMDKAKAAAAKVENAKVESVTDKNGLQAVKVTFDSGILFNLNKSNLSSSAKGALSKFSTVLMNNKDMDIVIYGHTDNTGSDAINNPLSLKRAQAVQSYLNQCGVSSVQTKEVLGKGSTEPIATNATREGQAQNRRVEIYMYASENMIKSANNGTLQ
ncbi:MAG: OmpA family protein [Bacteroidaceae bacterium]